MRLFLTLVLGALLIGGGAAYGAPTVSLTGFNNTLTASVRPGQSFTVYVKVNVDAQAISGCQVDLNASGPANNMITVGAQAYSPTNKDWDTGTTALAAMSGTVPTGAGPHGTGAVSTLINKPTGTKMSKITLTMSASATAGQVYNLWAAGNAFPDYNVSTADLAVSSSAAPLVVTVVAAPACNRTIAGRYIFYNHSSWDATNANPQPPDANTLAGGNNRNDDQDAIPTYKVPAIPPMAARATAANFINYSKGINGLIIDFSRGACPALADNLQPEDFTFKYGNTNTPGSWVAANIPTVVKVFPGVPNATTDRVTIIWPNLSDDLPAPWTPGGTATSYYMNPASDIPVPMNGAIPNANWLEVQIKSTANGGKIGLAANDRFYWGLAAADAEDQGPTATAAPVNATDDINARNNPRSTVPGQTPAKLWEPWDYNRDRNVNSTDQILARNNQTNTLPGTRLSALRMIKVP